MELIHKIRRGFIDRNRNRSQRVREPALSLRDTGGGAMSGPKLHGVSRTQAIAEGVLFDVSDLAHKAGFRCPLAVTPEALGACFGYGEAFESDGGPYTAKEEACLRDLLKLLRHAHIPLDGGSNRVDFVVDVLNETRREMPPVMQLCVACGLRHKDLPAITVMLPTESDSAYDDRVSETGHSCAVRVAAAKSGRFWNDATVFAAVPGSRPGAVKNSIARTIATSPNAPAEFPSFPRRAKSRGRTRPPLTRAASPKSGCHPA